MFYQVTVQAGATHSDSLMWNRNIQKERRACHQKTGTQASDTWICSSWPFADTVPASVFLSGQDF